ncbi:MAG: hypothetical protein R3F45_13155 [Gammaproteobacteria bacterium]
MPRHREMQAGHVRHVLAAWLALVLIAAAPSPASAAPADVRFGMYVTGIHGLDVVNNSYDMDLYVWWVSEKHAINPVSDFQIVNGRHWQVRSVNSRTLPDGSRYNAAFVSATVNHNWNLRRYPFDRHVLRVIFETPYTASELRLVPDIVDSKLSELVDLPGFRLGTLRLLEHVKGYDTRFGLGTEKADQFSRVVMELEITRDSQYLVATQFTGLLVANLISLLIYMVNVSALGIRATLATTAILAGVGNVYTLGEHVTRAARSLLVSQLATATFLMIVVALVTSIAAEWLLERDRGQAAVRLNWTACIVVTILFLAYVTWLVVEAMS